MKTINVNKDQLLETLKSNRDKHSKEVAELREDYRKQIVAAGEEYLTKVKKHSEKDKIERWNQSPEFIPWPEDHTDEYDRAIEMLRWHTGSEIDLTEAEFSQFVQDDWEWRTKFEVSKSSLVSNKTKFNY